MWLVLAVVDLERLLDQGHQAVCRHGLGALER